MEPHLPKDKETRGKIHGIISDNYQRNNLRYHENENQLPVIENWNKCLGFASGELFILFSDDDIYHPDFISELVRLSDEYRECNLFHCRVMQIDKDGEITYLTENCPSHEGMLDFMWHRIKGYRSLFIPDFMCRTQSLREIGGFQDLPIAWGTDDITWFMIAKYGGVAFTPRALCSWRMSGLNTSSIGNIHGRLSSLDVYLERVRSILDDVRPAGVEEEFLLTDILKQVYIWRRKAQVQLFRSYRNYNSYFKTLVLAISYRLRRKIGFKTFARAVSNSTTSLFKPKE